MATRNDVSVAERRLRPIYEWLDWGANRKAVQEADKVLKKQANLLCAKVLKCLALFRLGRASECVPIIDSVVENGTSDDATLQALTIYFKEIHEIEKICTVYEKAVKLDPGNEEILSHLFMAYVRVGEYKKQQQVAMHLYKLKPKNPYYFWAVMSIVMQALSSKIESSKSLSLCLAERMVKKFVDESKIDSEAEALCYLFILEKQGKFSEALSTLEIFLPKITQQPRNFFPLKRATYHFEIKDYISAAKIYLELIETESENFIHYTKFVETVVALSQNNLNLPQWEEENVILSAVKFLLSIQHRFKKGSLQCRSPQLAVLELILSLNNNGIDYRDVEILSGDTSELIYQYVCDFGDRLCCFSDLSKYFGLLPMKFSQILLSRLLQIGNFNKDGTPKDVKSMHLNQVYLKLCHMWQSNSNKDVLTDVETITKLVNFYSKTLPLSVQKTSTDLRPNDTYLLLAADVCLTLVWQLGYSHLNKNCEQNIAEAQNLNANETHEPEALSLALLLLVKLCSILEYGIKNSKANFQLKLMLIKAFTMIGAVESAYMVFEQLDLKQIQFDSLGHILTTQLMDLGSYGSALTVFSATLRFFMANFKDTSDPLIMYYKFGSLIRIPEFTEFKERLNKSLHFAAVSVEQMILEMVTRVNSEEELDNIMSEFSIEPWAERTQFELLADNRDLTVLENLFVTQKCVDVKKESFIEEKNLLIVRDTIVRLIAAVCSLRNFKCSENKHQMLNGCVNPQSAQPEKQKISKISTKSEITKNIKVYKSSDLKIEKSQIAHDTNVTDSSNNVNEDTNDRVKNLKELIEQLKSCLQTCDEYSSLPHLHRFLVLDFSRVYIYISGDYGSCTVKVAELFLCVHEASNTENSIEKWDQAYQLLKEANDMINDLFSFHEKQLNLIHPSSQPNSIKYNRIALSYLSHFVQTISFLTIFANCFYNVVKPRNNSKSGNKNRKKKKNVANSENDGAALVKKYVSNLHKNLELFKTNLSIKVSEVEVKNDCIDQTARVEFENLKIEQNSDDNQLVIGNCVSESSRNINSSETNHFLEAPLNALIQKLTENFKESDIFLENIKNDTEVDCVDGRVIKPSQTQVENSSYKIVVGSESSSSVNYISNFSKAVSDMIICDNSDIICGKIDASIGLSLTNFIVSVKAKIRYLQNFKIDVNNSHS